MPGWNPLLNRAAAFALLLIAVPGTAQLDPDWLPAPAQDFLVRAEVVLTGEGRRLEPGWVAVRGGRIEAVGEGNGPPDREAWGDLTVIDATPGWLTPGLIDLHVRVRVDVLQRPGQGLPVRAREFLRPQDPVFGRALEGGITTLHLLPETSGASGSMGGSMGVSMGMTVRNVPASVASEMRFPGAPDSLILGCDGQANGAGPVSVHRAALVRAAEYRARQVADADPELEALAGILDGSVLVHATCHRAAGMDLMLELAAEMDFEVAAFHHAVEAYKIAGRLSASGTCAASWVDWNAFRPEALDAIRENHGLVTESGGCAIVHADTGPGNRLLNQEAARAMAAARRAGIPIPAEQAIAWLTINPARALGIDIETGSLQPGKSADLVLWDGDPFSVYSRPRRIWIGGDPVLDRPWPVSAPGGDPSA